MSRLTEKDFSNIKDEIQNGRLTMSGMRVYLIGLFAYSGFLVGLSFAVANGNMVGWDNLSDNWHVIYYIEAVLLVIHLFIICLCWAKNSLNQRVLSIAMILFTYKTALDQFLTMSMFLKDNQVFDQFIPLLLMIIVSGFILHIVILVKWIKGISKKEFEEKNSKKSSKSGIWVSGIFLLAVLTGIIIRNDLLGAYDNFFGIFVISVVYLGLLIGACEFIIAAYCVFRYPSFSVKNFKNKK